jgi:hypothetical protein
MEIFRGTIKIPAKSFPGRRKQNALGLPSRKDSVISRENGRRGRDNSKNSLHFDPCEHLYLTPLSKTFYFFFFSTTSREATVMSSSG